MSEKPRSDPPAESATPASSELPYRVEALAQRTPTIVERWLRPLAERLRYRPGEHVLLEDAHHEVALRTGARRSLTLIFPARTEAEALDRERLRRGTRRVPRARSHGGVLRRTGAPDGYLPAGEGADVRPGASRAGDSDRPSIYTQTGDDGTTGLLFGGRVSKADPVIAACGALDEAIAALGTGRATLESGGLRATVLELQRGLFAAVAELAANPRAHERLVPRISSVTDEMTSTLEQRIDALLADHPLRPAFMVPGATLCSAALDLARTFLRRAKRRLLAGREHGRAVGAPLLAYVNRASDLAYVLARRAAGGDEPPSHE
jgi:cob(I)alamin adenosyltransferase